MMLFFLKHQFSAPAMVKNCYVWLVLPLLLDFAGPQDDWSATWIPWGRRSALLW